MRTTAKQLAQVLYELTDNKSNADIQKSAADFACYVYRNRKLKLTGKIIDQFSAIYNKEKGIVEAEVVSRKKLGDIETKKIKHFLKEKYEAKEVILKNIVDPGIKGGIILRVGDEIVDGSIRGQLDRLKKALVA